MYQMHLYETPSKRYTLLNYFNVPELLMYVPAQLYDPSLAEHFGQVIYQEIKAIISILKTSKA